MTIFQKTVKAAQELAKTEAFKTDTHRQNSREINKECLSLGLKYDLYFTEDNGFLTGVSLKSNKSATVAV